MSLTGQFTFARLVRAYVTAALAVGGLGSCNGVSAAVFTWSIDSSKSNIHIVNVQDDGSSPPSPLQNSTILGTPVIPQVAGAATTSLSGSIIADLTSNVFTFNGASNITLDANALGPFLPAANPGTDNLGIITNGNTALGVPVSVVIRNQAFTIQSGSVAVNSAPSGLTLLTTAGYQVNSFTGLTSLVGNTGPDSATSNVTLSTSGGVETLVIPVIRLPAAGTPGQVYIEGEIFATRQVVPEASSIALIAAGAGSFLLVGIRRRFVSKSAR